MLRVSSFSSNRSQFARTSATNPHCPSPKTAACSISGEAVNKFSTRVGETFLPVERTIKFFLAAANREKPVRIELAQVARVEPAVANYFGGRGLVVPVAEHHMRPARQDFAVVGDPHFDVRDRLADAAQTRFACVDIAITGDASVRP